MCFLKVHVLRISWIWNVDYWGTCLETFQKLSNKISKTFETYNSGNKHDELKKNEKWIGKCKMIGKAVRGRCLVKTVLLVADGVVRSKCS